VAPSNGSGDGPNNRRIAQRSGLQCGHRKVGHHRFDLLAYELWIQAIDSGYPDRILDRNQGDHRRAVNPVLVKGLQIGLDAGSAAGVRAGDR